MDAFVRLSHQLTRIIVLVFVQISLRALVFNVLALTGMDCCVSMPFYLKFLTFLSIPHGLFSQFFFNLRCALLIGFGIFSGRKFVSRVVHIIRWLLIPTRKICIRNLFILLHHFTQEFFCLSLLYTSSWNFHVLKWILWYLWNFKRAKFCIFRQLRLFALCRILLQSILLLRISVILYDKASFHVSWVLSFVILEFSTIFILFYCIKE